MCEPIITMPWQCGEKDCAQQWHQTTYWIADKGYTVDTFSDGDHEPCEESDLPTSEEVNAAWLEYAQYVADTGEDPLGSYFARRTIKRKARWEFKFAPCIGGIFLVSARRRGKLVDRLDLPEYVVTFLNLNRTRRTLRDFKSAAEALAAGVKIYSWHRETLTHETPNPHYASELKRLARKHLERNA